MELHAVENNPQSESLEDENARLKDALDDCRARILELNREDNRFTDGDARKKFEDLHSCIEDWLNDFLDRDGMYIAWERGTHIERYTKRYNSVGIPKDIFPLSSKPDLLSAIEWLRGKRCYDRFMLSLVTWCFLENIVFSENLPLGTGHWSRKYRESQQYGDIPFIDGVQKVLAGVDQTSSRLPRAGKWRSETLTAMIQMPIFLERQRQNIANVADVLEGELLGCVRTSNLEELKDFCRQCVKLAVELQTELLCCLSSYVVEFPSPLKQASDGSAKEWNLRHIDTWRAVTSDANIKFVKALVPGLYRKTTAEGQSEMVEVVRPLMIVCDENDLCITRVNQASTISRTARHASRPREVKLPGDDAKMRKPTISSTLSGILGRPKKTNAGCQSSDERGAKLQVRPDADTVQRTTKESYNEHDWTFARASPDQEFDERPVVSDELSSSSDSGVSRQSLTRKCPEFVHNAECSQTHQEDPRDRRSITAMSPDRGPVGREYRSVPGVKLASTMHDVGVPSSSMAAS